MHRRTTLRIVTGRLLGFAVALLLAGCAATPVSHESRLAYDRARDALEAGDYPTAVNLYENLVAHSSNDSIGFAVRRDYAHALLRAGQPDRALEVAREIATLHPHSGAIGQAKLVAAVAEHEIADRAHARGAPYEEAHTRATAAFRSLDYVLRNHSQYDPEGVLIVRMRKLRETLAVLEVTQLRADLGAGRTRAAAKRAAYLMQEFGDTAAVNEAQTLLRSVHASE